MAPNLEMKLHDANQYLSQFLLFAKTGAHTVGTRVYAAFQDYLNFYWKMLGNAEQLIDESDI